MTCFPLAILRADVQFADSFNIGSGTHSGPEPDI